MQDKPGTSGIQSIWKEGSRGVMSIDSGRGYDSAVSESIDDIEREMKGRSILGHTP